MMITGIVVTVIINGALALFWWILIKKAKEERSVLIRQNLVYLIAFVNYFDWLEKNYASGVIAAVMGDNDYVQYMKKNGLPEKAFSGIVENALQKSNAELINKTNEVMVAIKTPLSAEINALLENE